MAGAVAEDGQVAVWDVLAAGREVRGSVCVCVSIKDLDPPVNHKFLGIASLHGQPVIHWLQVDIKLVYWCIYGQQ
jgi:hypothetical protein